MYNPSLFSTFDLYVNFRFFSRRVVLSSTLSNYFTASNKKNVSKTGCNCTFLMHVNNFRKKIPFYIRHIHICQQYRVRIVIVP